MKISLLLGLPVWIGFGSRQIQIQTENAVTKFWKFHNVDMVIPEIERKSLDFYELMEMIAKLGGSEEISKKRNWPQLALEMGFARQENGYVLWHYEKYLEPFLTYINQEKSDIKSNKNLILGKSKEMNLSKCESVDLDEEESSNMEVMITEQKLHKVFCFWDFKDRTGCFRDSRR
jgi:hypothetical protein